jgi:hypothetical protein
VNSPACDHKRMDRNRSSMHSTVSNISLLETNNSCLTFVETEPTKYIISNHTIDHGQANVLRNYTTGIVIEQVPLVSKLVEHIHIFHNNGLLGPHHT